MSDQTRRRVLAGVGGGTAAALLGGASTAMARDEHEEQPRGPPGVTTVKVAHMSPDAPNVDVYVNGMAVLQDVAFRTVSGNFVFRPGEYQIQVTPTGEAPEDAVIDASLDFIGRSFTVLATGEVSEENRPFYPLVHPTSLAPLGDDMSRIRVFHLSPDAPEVDVAPNGGDPLFQGVGYSQNRTAEVPAGDYTLDVRPAGEEDVVTQFDVSLAPGWVYTGYVVGYAAPEEAPADEQLDLVTEIDAATPGHMMGPGNGNGDGNGNGEDDADEDDDY